MINLFGFQIGRKDKEIKENEKTPSFAPPENEDGSLELSPGGSYGTFVDLEGTARNEAELIGRYRDMAMQAECDGAIDDIVNEAIVYDDQDQPVEIVLDQLETPARIKKLIVEEFDEIIDKLKFNDKCYDIFRKWYVDGRIYYHIIVDINDPSSGIKHLRYIDPRKIKKVREPIEKRDPRTGVKINLGYNEYYIYTPRGVMAQGQGLKIAKDSICYITSGVLDKNNTMVLSYLHKAIKPLNQLRMLEDATVIYRLARAPERRIFYVDVGNLPKIKAEQYLRDTMVKHKNKLVYDASTGEVRDDRKFMTMLEDFWLPRREGGRGTEVTTLPGGQNLGEMEDVNYFERKMYRALNVPVGRLQSDGQFNLGRASEITRDEVKFSKFIKRLRLRFSMLFDELLEIQLALKGIMSREEFREIKSKIQYHFNEDNHFTELKESEILRDRLNMLTEADPFVGKYFSHRTICQQILRMTEEEIEEEKKQIEKEAAESPDLHDPTDPSFQQDPEEEMPPDDQQQQPQAEPGPIDSVNPQTTTTK